MDLRRVFNRVSNKTEPKKSEKDSFFLAVKISSTSVLATVWTIDGGKVTIGEVGVAPLVEKDYEHLLKSCDQAISHASIKTTPNVEKAIFAVPHAWVVDGKIVSEHLQTLRRICKELDLVPLGYVVTIEALENLYKEVEGAPLTAILIGIDEDRSVLTIFRAGKDFGTVSVGINSAQPDQISPAIEAAIKRFPHIDALPSRIILYNSGSDLDKVAQKITAYPWTGKLPFLHFPKVEKAPAEFVIKAVAAAGGIQMGASFNAQELVPSRLEHRESASIDEINELEEVSPEEAGFVTESDYSQISIPTSHFKTPSEELSPSFSEIAAPTANLNPSPKPAKKLNLKPTMNFKKIISNLTNTVASFGSRLKKAKTASTEVSVPRTMHFPTTVSLILIAVLLVVFVLFIALTYFLPKATLIVSVNSKNFNHEMSVGVTTSETASPSGKSIPGSYVEVSEIGTKKSSATGQKLVGTKAKGNVTIYGVSDSKKFPANTTLTAPNGLKFTLDTDTSVASGDAVTPATVIAPVHATDIGDTYNLSAGARLTIGNSFPSDYLAKNDSAFSGGASHQATVVTKVDQDHLMSTLSAELSEQAKTDLQAKLGTSQTLLPNAITFSVSKKKFSKDVDAEADNVSLDLTMDFRAVVFSKDDVITLFANEFSFEIPSGYSLTPKNTAIEVASAATDKKGNTTLALSASANLTPEINSTEIVSHVSGKSFKFATDYISHFPGVAAVKLEVVPNIFKSILNMFLPWKKDNLKVEIITQ